VITILCTEYCADNQYRNKQRNDNDQPAYTYFYHVLPFG